MRLCLHRIKFLLIWSLKKNQAGTKGLEKTARMNPLPVVHQLLGWILLRLTKIHFQVLLMDTNHPLLRNYPHPRSASIPIVLIAVSMVLCCREKSQRARRGRLKFLVKSLGKSVLLSPQAVLVAAVEVHRRIRFLDYYLWRATLRPLLSTWVFICWVPESIVIQVI